MEARAVSRISPRTRSCAVVQPSRDCRIRSSANEEDTVWSGAKLLIAVLILLLAWILFGTAIPRW